MAGLLRTAFVRFIVLETNEEIVQKFGQKKHNLK